MAIAVGVVFYIFLAWVMAVGFGIDHIDQWATNPAALDTLATRYAGTWLAVLVDLGVSVGALVAALAGVNLTSRTLFAMAREGGAPRPFATTNARFGTPWAAIGAVLALTLTLVVALAWIAWDDPFKYFGFMATTATFAILGTYILIALAGMVFFWRSRSQDTAFQIVFDLLLPAGAVAICGYTIYESFKAPGPPPEHRISLDRAGVAGRRPRGARLADLAASRARACLRLHPGRERGAARSGHPHGATTRRAG